VTWSWFSISKKREDAAPQGCGQLSALRRRWCLGIAEADGRATGGEHYGEERAETKAAKAEWIVAQELKRRKWTASDLQTRPKGAAGKFAGGDDDDNGVDGGAGGDGHASYLNHLLYRRRKSRQKYPELTPL